MVERPDNNHQAMNRRRALQLFGAATGTIGLAGCLGQSESSDPPQTGTAEATSDNGWPDLSGEEVMFLTDDNSDAMKEFLSSVGTDFQSATGAQLNVEYTKLGGLEERLSQLIQAGDPPEIYQSSTSEATKSASEGQLVDISDVLATMEEDYGYTVSDSTRVQIDGNDYIAPIAGNVGTNTYRSDLYEEEPKTWDIQLEQAKKVSEETDQTGTFIPVGQNICTDLHLLYYAASNEARVAGRSSEGDIEIVMDQGENRQRWVDVLTHLQKLFKYSAESSGASCGEQISAVVSGNSAHTMYPGARVKVDAVDQDVSFAKEVSLAKQPGPTENDRTTLGLLNGLISFKGSNTRGAKTFLEFLMQREYLTEFLLQTPIQLMPLFPEIKDSDRYQQGLEELPDAWTDSDIENALSVSEDLITLAGETQPPNPYAGVIFGSRALSKLQNEVLVRERDPGEMIDKYASELQSAIEEAR